VSLTGASVCPPPHKVLTPESPTVSRPRSRMVLVTVVHHPPSGQGPSRTEERRSGRRVLDELYIACIELHGHVRAFCVVIFTQPFDPGALLFIDRTLSFRPPAFQLVACTLTEAAEYLAFTLFLPLGVSSPLAFRCGRIFSPPHFYILRH
jgi:hypothetical protein